MLRVLATRLISKRHLSLKCVECKRLLPAVHFKSACKLSSNVTCVECKRLCAHCGLRLPHADFAAADAELCDRCTAKKHVAQENVFYRYPVLTYRACPFSAERMREELMQESAAVEGPAASHTTSRRPIRSNDCRVRGK